MTGLIRHRGHRFTTKQQLDAIEAAIREQLDRAIDTNRLFRQYLEQRGLMREFELWQANRWREDRDVAAIAARWKCKPELVELHRSAETCWDGRPHAAGCMMHRAPGPDLTPRDAA